MVKHTPVPTPPMPTLPTLQTTVGIAEDDIITTQITLPHDIRPAEQTGGDPHAILHRQGGLHVITQTTETPHESGADSRKRQGEAGLITDSQHRGD